MKPKPSASAPMFLDLPGARYFPDVRLVTWHPTGLFDDVLADQVVGFIESEERISGKVFHRYTDLSGLDRISLSLHHVFEIAQRRKKGYRGAPVKSAFFAVRLISVTIARMYQELMQDSPILIGVFRDRAASAEWLDVPEEYLHPAHPAGT